MTQISNFNSIEELISSKNINTIIDYINSEEKYDFEKKYIDKLFEFEDIYNKIFFEKKKQFYSMNSIHIESKFKNKTSAWMIERLLEIDLEDSINKYGFLNIINIHKKKYNLL